MNYLDYILKYQVPSNPILQVNLNVENYGEFSPTWNQGVILEAPKLGIILRSANKINNLIRKISPSAAASNEALGDKITDWYDNSLFTDVAYIAPVVGPIMGGVSTLNAASTGNITSAIPMLKKINTLEKNINTTIDSDSSTLDKVQSGISIAASVLPKKYGQYARYLNTGINMGRKAFSSFGKGGKVQTFQPGGGFLSTIDWSPEVHFARAVVNDLDPAYEFGKGRYTEGMAKDLASHVPEYLEIERRAKEDGTWERELEYLTPDQLRDWILKHSNAFRDLNLDEQAWYSGLSNEGYAENGTSKEYRLAYDNEDFNIWTSDNPDEALEYAYKRNLSGIGNRRDRPYDKGVYDTKGGTVFQLYFPKAGEKDLVLGGENGDQDYFYSWNHMPYDLTTFLKVPNKNTADDVEWTTEGPKAMYYPINGGATTDALVQAAGKAGYNTVELKNWIDEGTYRDALLYNYGEEDGPVEGQRAKSVIKEKIRPAGSNTKVVAFPNSGSFKGVDENGKPNIYARINTTGMYNAKQGGSLNYLNYIK